MSNLDPDKPVTDVSAPKPEGPCLVHRRWFVLLMLFAGLGPLGLPLLWRSPEFRRSGKVLLTVAVAVLTVLVVWLLWWAVCLLADQLREARDLWVF